MTTRLESPSTSKPFRPSAAICKVGLVCLSLHVTWSASSQAGDLETIPVSAAERGADITTSSQGSSPDVRLLMIHARWCGPCQQVKRNVLPQLGVDYSETGEDPICLIDSGKSPQSIKEYGVKALPTFILQRREGDDWKSVRQTSGVLTVAGFHKTFPELLKQ